MAYDEKVLAEPYLIASSPFVIPTNLDPPAKVLVLACIDPRFTAYLEWFLTHKADIKGQYDLFALAGSSLGVTMFSPLTDTVPSGFNITPYGSFIPSETFLGYPNWKTVFLNHLSLAKNLHSITDVWVFDHFDCGAYKTFRYGNANAIDDNIHDHTFELSRLRNIILDTNPEIKFQGFVMNLDGSIQKVISSGDSLIEIAKLEPMDTYSTLYWIIFLSYLLMFIFVQKY